MLGSLLFAYLFSDTFEMYTKEYRLLADILNNVALIIDLISAHFPDIFIYLASLSTVCKACCGLVAGATKSRISAHFCLNKGSLADGTNPNPNPNPDPDPNPNPHPHKAQPVVAHGLPKILLRGEML